jgi:peptide/nickel transport system ATP-binding protein
MTKINPETILKVDSLSTNFEAKSGNVRAVKGLSFNLKKGETLGIVGESGSGKSVTSLSIMQLLDYPGKIVDGQIVFCSENSCTDLLSLNESELRKYRGSKIAMIFQEPMSSLNPVMRCGKQVMEAILTHQKISKKEAKQRVFELFEEVKLPDPERIFSSYPHQLSGGQIQRIMIAMAISNNPSILIADEPTTALDVTVQKDIIKLLNSLQEKHGSSIIFISHDLAVIAEIADRVLVMLNGEKVELANVTEIFESPKHPYTKGLIACRPPLNKKLKRLPVVSDFMDQGVNEQGDLVINEKKISKPQEELTARDIENRVKYLTEQEDILRVKGLKCWYPKKTNFLGKVLEYTKAVNGVDFTVRKGETLGLVGESGCGKSSIGRTLVRLFPAIEGTAHFMGSDIFKLEDSSLRTFRKNMQIIFQDPYSSLNPRMKIGEAIREPMVIHNLFGKTKDEKEKVTELLETVGLLPDHYHRYPHEFSGGQRQRICIARSLALEPKFLICDESVSALDVSVQAQVLNLLLDLREKLDLSMIFISHDLSVVKFLCDRILVMYQGEIVERGEAEQIYFNPKNAYTRNLIDAIPKGLVKKL